MQNSHRTAERTNSGETPPAPTPAPPTVTLTLDELDARIAAGIAAANQKVADEQKAAALVAETLAKATVPATVASTWPYGNQDRRDQFDLSKLTTLQELPSDKVIIALPAYNRDADGAVIGIDMKNTRVQFLDPAHFQAVSKPDKETATTTFQMLGIDPIVLHKPE